MSQFRNKSIFLYLNLETSVLLENFFVQIIDIKIRISKSLYCEMWEIWFAEPILNLAHRKKLT